MAGLKISKAISLSTDAQDLENVESMQSVTLSTSARVSKFAKLTTSMPLE